MDDEFYKFVDVGACLFIVFKLGLQREGQSCLDASARFPSRALMPPHVSHPLVAFPLGRC